MHARSNSKNIEIISLTSLERDGTLLRRIALYIFPVFRRKPLPRIKSPFLFVDTASNYESLGIKATFLRLNFARDTDKNGRGKNAGVSRDPLVAVRCWTRKHMVVYRTVYIIILQYVSRTNEPNNT